jgi:hypothetical protein
MLVVVDCESDGPVPPIYSLVCFGAVIVEPALNRTFYGKTTPISVKFDPNALAISGFSREEHFTFDDPGLVFHQFAEWLDENSGGKRPTFISDNPCYDWQWMNYYFHRYLGKNPFGFSGRRIGDLFSGLHKDARKPWKHLRKTLHDHNPVNDAKGNAEVLLTLGEEIRGLV